MKWLIGICVFLTLMMTTSANAQVVIDFEDLEGGSSSAYLPDGYAGLDWDPLWFHWEFAQWPYTPASGTQRIATHNYGGYIGFPYAVVFDGAYFSGLDYVDVYLEGYLGATLVGTSATLDLSDTPTFINANFGGLIDTAVVVCSEYNQFAMDDVTYSPLLEVEKTLDDVDDDDGDDKIEVGEPVTFTMTVTVTNVSGSLIEDVKIIDGIGGDLRLVSVDGNLIPPPPGTKKKKDNEVTVAGYISVAWSGETQKAHLTCSMGDLADGESASVEIVVETDINPGQGKKAEPVHEFTSAEEDHELNKATAIGMVDGVEVGGISNVILIDIVEPD